MFLNPCCASPDVTRRLSFHIAILQTEILICFTLSCSLWLLQSLVLPTLSKNILLCLLAYNSWIPAALTEGMIGTPASCDKLWWHFSRIFLIGTPSHLKFLNWKRHSKDHRTSWREDKQLNDWAGVCKILLPYISGWQTYLLLKSKERGRRIGAYLHSGIKTIFHQLRINTMISCNQGEQQLYYKTLAWSHAH